VAPEPLLHDPPAVAPHLPEEVVRGEEHEAAAEIAIPLDDVVAALGDVLLVAREDDQVVRGAQPVARSRPLEVVVGEAIDPLARPVQPGEKL
jgi:hypothetical protein